MPVVIERDKRSGIHTSTRAGKQQKPAANHRLIYSCIVVIIVCWCLVAFQVFGGSLGQSKVAQTPTSAPDGIKLMLPKAP